MDICIIVGLSVLAFMVGGWLIGMGVCYHWDFRKWYHDSDNDL